MYETILRHTDHLFLHNSVHNLGVLGEHVSRLFGEQISNTWLCSRCRRNSPVLSAQAARLSKQEISELHKVKLPTMSYGQTRTMLINGEGLVFLQISICCQLMRAETAMVLKARL